MFPQAKQEVCLQLHVLGGSLQDGTCVLQPAEGWVVGRGHPLGVMVAGGFWPWPLSCSVWLQELGVSFDECSAALGHNILEPIMNLAR